MLLAMNQFPITSTSIFVRRKQSSASSGRHTTGSFSLNEAQCLTRRKRSSSVAATSTPSRSTQAEASPW